MQYMKRVDVPAAKKNKKKQKNTLVTITTSSRRQRRQTPGMKQRTSDELEGLRLHGLLGINFRNGRHNGGCRKDFNWTLDDQAGVWRGDC